MLLRDCVDESTEGNMRFCKMKVTGEVEKNRILLNLLLPLYLPCYIVCLISRLKAPGQ